jgi:phage tail sheath gpL-like
LKKLWKYFDHYIEEIVCCNFFLFYLSDILPVEMLPNEGSEMEQLSNNSPKMDDSFAQEVVKEALGELYTEHIKITVHSNKSDNLHKLSAFQQQQQQQQQQQTGHCVNSDLQTFKQVTYFGASTKSSSFDENLLRKEEEKIVARNEGKN